MLVALCAFSACQHGGTSHPANVGSTAPDSTLLATPGPPPSTTGSSGSHGTIPPGGLSPPGPPPGSPNGPPEPKQRNVEFRAIGVENDWILEIDQEWIMFVHDFGQERIMARVPEPEPGPGSGGFTFRASSTEGRSIEVIWEGRICSDVTSGQPNQNSVIVRLDGLEYRGCGLRRTSTSEPKNR